MTASRRNINRQIAARRKNLELIEVRKSEYVLPTDIPLQLLKTEEETRTDLARLEAELAALPEGEDGKGPGPHPWPIIVGAAAVIALVASSIWFWNSRTPPSPPPTPLVEPTPAPAHTVVQGAAATPEPATPPPESQPMPTLPAFAPMLTTTVMLLSGPLCAAEQASLAAFLADMTGTATPPVVLKAQTSTAQSAAERGEVRAAGAAAGADLIIWCTSEETGPALHFEALTQRAAPEVYEPPTISLPATSVDRSQRAALGMVEYLRRNYVRAQPLLRTAADMSTEMTVEAALLLLIGNAQTFSRDYSAAATSYKAAVKAAPQWAQAWHNLGVAELNAAWDSHEFDNALAALENAIALEPDFELPLLSLGRIYRWTYDEVDGNGERAFATCAQAARSSSPTMRVHGIICTYLTRVLMEWGGDPDKGLLQSGEGEALEDAATPYWAQPLILLGNVQSDYWFANRDPVARAHALAYFRQYLSAAQDDVHLEEARVQYRDAIDKFGLLLQDEEPKP